ncbi:hypothetical protein [Kitasatospora sp. NPDC058046]|uniref:hypothetical protein n=1 Tax=Kitasatospora sp. NPDC058046 TaxID=3346312 RepID=UPI0036D915E3
MPATPCTSTAPLPTHYEVEADDHEAAENAAVDLFESDAREDGFSRCNEMQVYAPKQRDEHALAAVTTLR